MPISAALVKRSAPGRMPPAMKLGLFFVGMTLLLIAVVGGAAIHSLFWLLVILALVAFAVEVLTGRTDA